MGAISSALIFDLSRWSNTFSKSTIKKTAVHSLQFNSINHFLNEVQYLAAFLFEFEQYLPTFSGVLKTQSNIYERAFSENSQLKP